MESDLSLLEISGEDDSLLLELPNDDASKLNSNNYFLCSPLQIHGSKPPRPLRSSIAKGKVSNVDTEKASPSLQTDSISKENINANKVEMQKLNMEPQQMKRKKKGGGYNLRKSLAWDRAFFTEEGVLNPSELSMISGSFSKVGGSGGMLSIIPEEGRESLSGASDGPHNAADLQSLEVDLFKELPTSVKKDGKSGSRLLQKHGSPARDNVAPASAAKRKVLATHNVNRSGSKRGGCPQPVAASSLKRPANVHTTKAETKASKVSKIPVSNLDSSVFSRTTKGTSGANDSRCNQITQPVNVQRKTGPKASSDSTKIVQNNPKSGPATKYLAAGTSVRQARRKMVISASEKHPPTNLQHPLVTEANNSSEIISDTLLPSTSHTPDSHDGGGNKVAVTLPQNACITGGQMQRAQLQEAKPSGLRMPSPSLGFFGQPKASLHNPLQRTSRPYRLPVSNTSNLRKPGATNHIHDLRPPLHPGKIPNMTTIGNMKVLGSGLGCSVPSTVNPAAHNKQDEKMKSILHMNNINRQVEVKVPYDNKCCEAIKNQNQLDSILDDVNQQVLESVEPLKTEVIAHREESELQRSYCGQLEKSDDNNKVADVCLRNRDLSGTELENPPSISSLNCVVQDNGVSETKDLIDHQSVEDKPYSLATKNDGAFPTSHSGDVSGSCTNISKSNDDWLSSVHDVREQSELMKPSTCEDGKISSESQRLWAKNGSFLKDNGDSKDFLKFNCLADVSPKIQGCSEIALRSSHGQSCFGYMEQAKDDAGKDDKMSSNALVGDAQAQLLEGDMLDATVKSSPSTSTVDGQYFMVVDDVNERIGEQLELCQTVESAILEANGACECKSNSSNTHCLISSAMQDCSCEVAKTMECQHVEDAPSGSVNSKPVVENYNSSIDTQFRHNVELHGQFSPLEMEMEMRGEDHMTGTGCPKSGDFSWNELENPHSACRLNPTVQVNGGSGIDDVIQREDVEEKKCNLLTKIPSATSESQPGNDIGDSHCDTSIVPIDLLSDMHVVNEHSVEQTKLSMLCPVEADYEENQSPETYSLLSAKSQSSEGSMRFNVRTAADNSKVKISGGSGYMTGTGCPKSGDFSGNELENPHPACRLSPTVQVNGGSWIYDVIQQEDVEEKKCNLLVKIPSATSESQPGDIGGCHCDTSMVPIDLLSDMHVVNEHSLEQTKLSMPCSAEADYEENQSPETYHSLLFAKSQSSEGSMRFNSRTDADISEAKGSGGSGLESPQVDQLSKDVDGFNDMYKESNLVQSSNGKISAGSFNSNVNISAASNQYLMVVDDVNDQSGHSELQNFILMGEQVLLDNNHGLCLNDDFLLANTTSEELKKESTMAGYDVYGSKSECSMLFSEATPTFQEDGVDADQKAEHLHMEDEVTGSVNIVPLVENLECCTDSKLRHDNGLSGQASLKFDSSTKMSTDQISGAVRTYNSKGFCSLSEESGLSILTDQSSESHNVMKSGSLSGEAETDISQICEMQQESDVVVYATDDKDATMKLSDGRRNPEDDNLENEKKQDALVIKPPPHAAPFSDEWLAAFESAGEEILTMKSGAVQHSPPDKSQPEPGPWSPVRRKNNQEIGPFDCTKYTNIPPSSSQ